jgi:hypothetical protein
MPTADARGKMCWNRCCHYVVAARLVAPGDNHACALAGECSGGRPADTRWTPVTSAILFFNRVL